MGSNKKGIKESGGPEKKLDKKSDKKSSSVASSSQFDPTQILWFIRSNIYYFVAFLVVTFAYVVYKNSGIGIKNYVNASDEVLKNALLGEFPYVHYCGRGGKEERVPSNVAELQKLLGDKIEFSILNCSQVLPSGKDIWKRFRLKKDWRPTVFVTSPWQGGKAKQVPPSSMKDVKTLQRYVLEAISARALTVESDKELGQYCLSPGSKVKKVEEDESTCIVIVKGSKYTSAHVEIEENLVKQNPKLRIVSIDSVKHRLSFEDSKKYPADSFSLRVLALRKGSFYMGMKKPVNAVNVESFVSSAVAAPLQDFKGDEAEPIKLVKPASKAFKSRVPKVPPQQNQQRAESFNAEEAKQEDANAKDEKDDSTKPETDEMRQEKLQRERERREEMERQAKEHLFESRRDEDEGAEDLENAGAEDEDEEDIIEL